jgi:hypothetical protein
MLVGLAASVFVWGSAPALARTCYTPTGDVRRAILDALRTPVAADLGQAVEFVVTRMTVCWQGEPAWAFVDARPQRPGGAPVNWGSAGYVDCSRTVQGLLKRGSPAGGWSVVESAVCPTDVPWAAWTEQYGAPAALFR